MPYTLDGLTTTTPDADAPSDQEVAAHLAITLWAWHQFGVGAGMHKPGVRFGVALRKVRTKLDPRNDVSVDQRSR